MSRFFKKTDKLPSKSQPPIESINPNFTDMINRLAVSTKPPAVPAFGSTASSSAPPNIVGPNEQMENNSTAQPPTENDPPRRRRKNNWMSSTVSIGQDEAYNQVCNFLKDDEVGMVGIYGMGGVGKTTLMKKIDKEFLKPSHFKVISVVVSKTVDMDSIQEVIMRNLNLPFDKKDDPSSRADKLHDALQGKKVAILFDDIWERLNLEELGILGQENVDTGSFKLIFTTRSEAVCEKMQSDELIKVEPLGWDDSWALFKRSVGSKNDIESCDASIVELAKDVAKECKGLPLALKVIGGAMACRRLLEEWRHALATLRRYPADMADAEEYLFTRLKFSFDSLSNRREKGCFLYTCFCPEDKVTEASLLLKCWIGEGILTLNGSYQEALDEGMNIFRTLQGACLFETLQYEPLSTRVHDVIRDMGIWIAKSNEIAEKTKPRQHFVCYDVSYRYEFRQEANCSNLTTLVMDGLSLTLIITFNFSCFASMSQLRVIKLERVRLGGSPTSIGELTELRHLELTETNLEGLPIEIRNLRKLQVMHHHNPNQNLNIDLPKVIGELVELRILVCMTKTLPTEIGNLHKLEELVIYHSEIEELPKTVGQLTELRKLDIRVHRASSRSHCVQVIPRGIFRNMHKLRELQLPVENYNTLPPCFFQGLTSLKCLSVSHRGNWGDEEAINDEVASFLTQLSPLPLRILRIKRCPIKKFQVPPTSNDLCFPWLEELDICNFLWLEKMQVMSQMALPCIRVLKITSSGSLKNISGLEHLHSLVVLDISDCGKLEEVIQVAGDQSTGLCFPKLERLWLSYLEQLKSICNDNISFPSLRDFGLHYCPGVRVLPRGLVKENKAPEECYIFGRRGWYDKLQWQDKDFKAALDPHFSPMS